MSLLWIEGFEGYGTTVDGAPLPSGVLNRRYTTTGLTSNCLLKAGRISGYSLYMAANQRYFLVSLANTDATLIIGLGFKYSGATDSTDFFVRTYDTGSYGIGFCITSGGEISVYRGSTLLGATSGSGLSKDVWYWLEFKIVVNDTTGSIEIKVGSETVLNLTGIDTKATSNAYYNQVAFGDIGSSNYVLPCFDDIYICNGAGAVNNDFLGNVRVSAIFPDGAGTTTAWTPSAGSNYACVDENPGNDDTDYVESSTSTQKDTYTYGDVAAITGIKGIQINTDCRETNATSFSLITVIRSGTTDYDDSAQGIGTTSYVTKSCIAELDPDTSAAWLYTGINSAEFGIKVG